MTDYLVHAWRLSDFSGDPCGFEKCDAASASDFAGQKASTTLSKDATGASFFITDEAVESTNSHSDALGSLSILTDKVSVDETTYEAGQIIDIECVLSMDNAQSPQIFVGQIAKNRAEAKTDRLVFSTAPIHPGQEFVFTDISNGKIQPDHTICFARGAEIDTPHGEIPVQELVAGDEVVTRDGGIATVQWVGKRTLSGFELALHPHLCPIRIRKNALGPNRPERDLIVSPQHRILVDDWRSELFFGEEEVLVPARSLLNGRDIVIDQLQTGVDYYHVLLENHELLAANGQWAESLFPSEEALETLAPGQREEIETIIPGFFASVSKNYVQALPTIRHEDAAALAA